MLVSHRNMISIYDMSKDENGWVQTLSFDAGIIRTMFIKKRPRRARVNLILEELKKFDIHNLEDHKGSVVLTNFQKYQITVIFGTHNLRYCSLDWQGKLE